MVMRSRLPRKAFGKKKERLARMPKKIVPEFQMPDKEFKLTQKGGGAFVYTSPTTGNKIEFYPAEIKGRKFYVRKLLAKTVVGDNYLIVSTKVYNNLDDAYKGKNEVPDSELREMLHVKVYEVDYKSGEWSEGKRIGESNGSVHVYAKNTQQALKRAKESVSHVEEVFNARQVPEPEGEQVY